AVTRTRLDGDDHVRFQIELGEDARHREGASHALASTLEGGKLRHILAAIVDRAGACDALAGQYLEQRALARTVRSDDGEGLAFFHPQGDAMQNLHRPIPGLHALYVQDPSALLPRFLANSRTTPRTP